MISVMGQLMARIRLDDYRPSPDWAALSERLGRMAIALTHRADNNARYPNPSYGARIPEIIERGTRPCPEFTGSRDGPGSCQVRHG